LKAMKLRIEEILLLRKKKLLKKKMF